jgi:hypothetical protein
MRSKLPSSAKATLKKASREAVEESLSYLKRHFKHARWVGTGNRYRTNTTERIYADTRPGQSLNHFQLTQYIAASAPLHCADGWSLLGRAIDCHARRDHDSARHFAYYAELRAAVSLLAAEGVAIFRSNHFVVEKLKQCGKFGGRTHEVTWQALEYWAELKRSSDLIGSSIRVNGITLEEWLEHFPVHSSLRAVGRKWLRTWGLDLRLLSEDQDIRNEASYRPTKLNERPMLDAEDSADFICAVWSLCEPSAHAPFNNLDRHLLRLALEETFHGVRGTTAAANAPQFKTDVAGMLSQILSDPAAQHEWLNFLTRAAEPRDPVILSEARQTDQIEAPRQHLQMISRAALLLRVATAANLRLMQEAHVSGKDVKFWWSAIGEERGLWMGGKQPTNLTDLWADVEAAVKNITEWKTKTAAADRGFVQWRQDRSYDISVLGGCERIALWGLEL